MEYRHHTLLHSGEVTCIFKVETTDEGDSWYTTVTMLDVVSADDGYKLNQYISSGTWNMLEMECDWLYRSSDFNEDYPEADS